MVARLRPVLETSGGSHARVAHEKELVVDVPRGRADDLFGPESLE